MESVGTYEQRRTMSDYLVNPFGPDTWDVLAAPSSGTMVHGAAAGGATARHAHLVSHRVASVSRLYRRRSPIRRLAWHLAT